MTDLPTLLLPPSPALRKRRAECPYEGSLPQERAVPQKRVKVLCGRGVGWWFKWCGPLSVALDVALDLGELLHQALAALLGDGELFRLKRDKRIEEEASEGQSRGFSL